MSFALSPTCCASAPAPCKCTQEFSLQEHGPLPSMWKTCMKLQAPLPCGGEPTHGRSLPLWVALPLRQTLIFIFPFFFFFYFVDKKEQHISLHYILIITFTKIYQGLKCIGLRIQYNKKKKSHQPSSNKCQTRKIPIRTVLTLKSLVLQRDEQD